MQYIKLIEIIFSLWIIIPFAAGECVGLTTCQRCISDSMCTFIKNRENELICVDKNALFNLRPKAVYKTPRRCNLLNKKKAAEQKHSNENAIKFEKGLLQEKNGGKQGSDSSRYLQDTADTVLSSLNQPSTSQPTSLLATKLLETSSVKLGNETVKNENSDMMQLLNQTTTTTPFSIFMTTESAQNVSVDETYVAPQIDAFKTVDVMNLLNQTTTTTPVSKIMTTESAPNVSVNDTYVAPPIHAYKTNDSDTGPSAISTMKPFHHSAVINNQQTVYANNSYLFTPANHSETIEVKKPNYPWIVNEAKYDLLRMEIIETCCKLEKLFREFGDIHFLEYDSIKNYNFVAFQIRNPLITRWNLCN